VVVGVSFVVFMSSILAATHSCVQYRNG